MSYRHVYDYRGQNTVTHRLLYLFRRIIDRWETQNQGYNVQFRVNN